ncbi:hypothetical protein ACIBEJ_00795 [Nonomuraea sp. NPDC050790]|uniref:Mom family adenine methylcarbamoylation protein n=1 Tax=Nonomuraea sp. NPDC050790 TaxID=3364371 RepID=UPI003787967A
MSRRWTQAALELDPVSDHGQRWRDRSFTWQAERYGAFRPELYGVKAISEGDGKAFVKQHHYSGSYPSTRLPGLDDAQFGLFDLSDPARERLVGVAAFARPTNDASLANVFPGLDPGVQSVVLGRFVLLDEIPHGGETATLREVFRLAGEQGVRGVLAYADPVARFTAAGQMVFAGHRGTIYRAHNGTYLGRTSPRLEWLLPDATVVQERGLQKVRKGERGARATEQLLVARGASERRPGQCRREWIAQALREVCARQVPHGGKHKFAWAVGPRGHRSQVTITGPFTDFPKGATSHG